MLRTNSVPWEVSPDRPAILSSVSWAGVQALTLHSLRLSRDVAEVKVDDIYCLFCLAEDEDLATECVILRCDRCKALSHLACAEEWLEKRSTCFGMSCCKCRNEAPLDGLIRPLRVSSSDAETHAVQTGSRIIS
ncbi:unnamed protein product [Penicillium nalgiovense]|nr:unnamed protein product [Penicillium nalgiovense]